MRASERAGPEAEARQRVLLSWSGGKDSAMALWALRESPTYEVAALLTTLTEDYDRISMHGVRRDLLRRQVRALGLPVHEMWIPRGADNARYEAALRRVLSACHEQGVATVAFGDLFLEDIRRYREEKLVGSGMRGLFPIWQRETRALAEEFIALGFRAVVVCVDPRALAPSFAGREFDRDFLNDLPAGVDPCGENGEFHTFVYAGPVFDHPVAVRTGQVIEREGFVFCDLESP